MTSTVQVTAVIPTFNGRRLLAKHLPAVLSALRDGDELLLVDDASQDDSVAWITSTYTLEHLPEKDGHLFAYWQKPLLISGKHIRCTLIVSQRNRRFAAAANLGVESASGQYILLLNSDVSPHADILRVLVPHFTQTPQMFAVGCLEKERQGGRTILGGKNTLIFSRGMFIHARAKSYTTGATAWVSGGSGLFDRAKWLSLGGFDARYYPAYWEDVDLSWQARQRGWKVWFDASAVVDHTHESTNQDVFGQQVMEAMSWQHAQAFVWKNGTLRQKVLFILWKPYWWWKLQQQKHRQGRTS